MISNFKLNQPGYQLMTLFNKSSHLGLTGQLYELFTRNNKTLVEIFFQDLTKTELEQINTDGNPQQVQIKGNISPKKSIGTVYDTSEKYNGNKCKQSLTCK